MNNLFAFLGWYGRIQTLRNEDYTLSELMKIFFPIQNDNNISAKTLLEILWKRFHQDKKSSKCCNKQGVLCILQYWLDGGKIKENRGKKEIKYMQQLATSKPAYLGEWFTKYMKDHYEIRFKHNYNYIYCNRHCKECAAGILNDYFKSVNVIDLVLPLKSQDSKTKDCKTMPLKTAINTTISLCEKNYIQDVLCEENYIQDSFRNLNTKIRTTQSNELPKDIKPAFTWNKGKLRCTLCKDISILMELSYLYTQTIQVGIKREYFSKALLAFSKFSNLAQSTQKSKEKLDAVKNLLEQDDEKIIQSIDKEAENIYTNMMKKFYAIQSKRYETTYMGQFLNRIFDVVSINDSLLVPRRLKESSIMKQYDCQQLYQLAELYENGYLTKNLSEEKLNFIIDLATPQEQLCDQIQYFINYNFFSKSDYTGFNDAEFDSEAFQRIRNTITPFHLPYTKIQLLLQWMTIRKEQYINDGTVDKLLSDILNTSKSDPRFNMRLDIYNSSFNNTLQSKLEKYPDLLKKICHTFVDKYDYAPEKAKTLLQNNPFIFNLQNLNEAEQFNLLKLILNEIKDKSEYADLKFKILRDVIIYPLKALKYYKEKGKRNTYSTHLYSSIVDAGIIMALLDTENAAKNPFIVSLSAERNQTFNAFNFLQLFSIAPITVDHSQYVLKYFNNIWPLDDDDKNPKVTSQFLTAFNQFTIERFTNINYLLALYNKIYSHLEFQVFVKKFDIIFKLLMLLPLPETRILIISEIEEIMTRCLEEKNFDKIKTYLSSMKKDCLNLYKELQFVLIPIAILTFHYVMSRLRQSNQNNVDANEVVSLNYFKLEEGKKNKKEIIPALGYQFPKTEQKLQSFSQFTLSFYQYFYEQTNYLNNPTLLTNPISELYLKQNFSVSNLKSELRKIHIDLIDEVFHIENIEKSAQHTQNIHPLIYVLYFDE